VAAVERDHILATLRACGGRQSEAARVLGIAQHPLAQARSVPRRRSGL